MSLIFEADPAARPAGAPATHVLLIGCGTYPGMAAAGYPGRAPLSTPGVSVQAMATWFLGGPDARAPASALPPEAAFFNPAAPLGSVDMLASPMDPFQGPGGAPSPVERPSFDNLRAACRRWLARLGTNAANHGVFYFCGHGFGDGAAQQLIADDFGDDPEDAWSAAFHVSNTCQAAIRKTSAKLLFLIDACMEFNQEPGFEIGGFRPLVPGKTSGPVLCTDWLVMRGCTTSRAAYSAPNGMAQFTWALLDALKGHCGRQRMGQALFHVTVSQLRDATSAFLDYHRLAGQSEWQQLGLEAGDGRWDFPIHVLTQSPKAIVHLDVAPPGFRPVAAVYVERGGVPRQVRPLAAGPAEFSLEWGEWTCGVLPSTDAFTEKRLQHMFAEAVAEPYSFPVP